MLKSKKFHALIFHKLEKFYFEPISCPFWPKNFKIKFFPKNILCLYATVTSCKRIKKLHALIFDKTWQNSFWAHFGTFWPEEVKVRFFPKSILSRYATVTLSKKNRTSLESQFSIKLEEPNFGLILVFLARKPDNKIFLKYFALLHTNFIFHTCVSFFTKF